MERFYTEEQKEVLKAFSQSMAAKVPMSESTGAAIIGRLGGEMMLSKDEELNKIFDALQGVTCAEWNRIREAVDNYFRNKASAQAKQIPMGSSEELMRSYKYLR